MATISRFSVDKKRQSRKQQQLFQEMTDLRNQMHVLYSLSISLSDPLLVAISQQLDEKVNEYYRLN